MTFPEAVKSSLSKYVVFSGQASRSEFWWFFLFNVIIHILTGIIDVALGIQIIGTLSSLALILPNIGVGVRRLHDIGRSGWWLLIGLLPIIGLIILLYFFTQPGKRDFDAKSSSNEVVIFITLPALGAFLGFFIGMITRPTVLGQKLPWQIIFGNHPDDEPFRSAMLEHLLTATGIGLGAGVFVSIALWVVIRSVKKA